ncbi:MAG: RnfABCDGE type electron transport complex subunit D, partial [Polyangiaceae bacterium]
MSIELNRAPAPVEVARAAAAAGAAPIVESDLRLATAGAGLGRVPAGLLPLAMIAVLLAISLIPRFAAEPVLVTSTRVTAAVLLAWLAIVVLSARRAGRRLAIDVRVVRAHYVQSLCHLAIFFYWGLIVPRIAAEAPLFLAQIALLIAADALLSWSRGRAFVLGFGALPIVFSTNFFLWFHHDWYFLQYAMIALAVFGKEFVRWQRDGRSAHIFNPSSFALAVASMALLVTGTTAITWGPELATTIGRPQHMYLLLFGLSLLPHLLFAVTPMTLAAVGTVIAWDLVYLRVTGGYFFIDTSIPAAVFLGAIFLFTDPATAPRSRAGRVIYGMGYGIGVCALFLVFRAFDLPAFYDKLLPVPVLNVAVRAIDRLAGSRAFAVFDRERILGVRLTPGRVNL